MKLAPTPEAMRPPRQDAMEVLLTLSPAQYEEMGDDLQRVRERLELPQSASNTQVILQAVHRAADPG